MPGKFEYTTLAHRYTARLPLIPYVGTQVNFWILADVLVVIMVHLYGKIISEMHSIPMDGDLGTFVLVAGIMGLVYGLGFGLTTYFVDQKFFRKRSSGKVLVYKTLISLALLLLVLTLLRFVLFDLLISPTFNMVNKKYGPGVRDRFADINEMLCPLCAQVYQHVGDEIVITWPSRYEMCPD